MCLEFMYNSYIFFKEFDARSAQLSQRYMCCLRCYWVLGIGYFVKIAYTIGSTGPLLILSYSMFSAEHRTARCACITNDCISFVGRAMTQTIATTVPMCFQCGRRTTYRNWVLYTRDRANSSSRPRVSNR